jgi:hypothetical protein
MENAVTMLKNYVNCCLSRLERHEHSREAGEFRRSIVEELGFAREGVPVAAVEAHYEPRTLRVLRPVGNFHIIVLLSSTHLNH